MDSRFFKLFLQVEIFECLFTAAYAEINLSVSTTASFAATVVPVSSSEVFERILCTRVRVRDQLFELFTLLSSRTSHILVHSRRAAFDRGRSTIRVRLKSQIVPFTLEPYCIVGFSTRNIVALADSKLPQVHVLVV